MTRFTHQTFTCLYPRVSALIRVPTAFPLIIGIARPTRNAGGFFVWGLYRARPLW